MSTQQGSTSIDFDMVDFRNSNELTHSYQDADMGLKNVNMETYFLPVRTVMDADNWP